MVAAVNTRSHPSAGRAADVYVDASATGATSEKVGDDFFGQLVAVEIFARHRAHVALIGRVEGVQTLVF